MDGLAWVLEAIGGECAECMRANASVLCEIRIRIGQRTCLRFVDGDELQAERIDRSRMLQILDKLTQNSFYAHENEMLEGYFTIPGGIRVGVCGKLVFCDGKLVQLVNPSSLCIRIPKAVCGCADEIAQLMRASWPCSALIISPPGLGKTTLLRDLVRQLSDAGINVAVVDERREIAACSEGMPQMDVGSHTDVMEGCPKSIAISALIRSCAPQLIALDEIGNAADARAIGDAARCGVAVIATMHAASIEEARQRLHIGPLIRAGIFNYLILLGGRPGRIAAVQKYDREVENGC